MPCLFSSMIGSISSTSFAHYGMQRSPQGERSADLPSSDEEEKDSQTSLKTEKGKKEEEEKFSNPQKLDEGEKEQVKKLKARDAEVRAHEQAHMAAAGSLAQGGPNYVFQTGPDGKQYAIGGSVKIDTSPGSTPEETQRKAQQIRAAALAPSDPSGQDLKVAASAASMEVEAASKVAEKSEKDANKQGFKSDGSAGDTKGEITSSRQVFAASPSDSETGKDEQENAHPRQNIYAQQAAKLYANN